jgi:C-terminal processing protease CtpA/Prc
VGIYPNTDAAASGINVGDQLYAINGYQIYDRELVKRLFEVQPGDKVTLTIQRKGNRFDCVVTALRPGAQKIVPTL